MTEAPRSYPGTESEAVWTHGYNSCLHMAISALNYLSSHLRPSGGQETYNAEHLLQIADEIKRTIAHNVKVTAPLDPAQGQQPCGAWQPSAEAIAAVIDPVAFDPISLADTHPSWEWRRETARATAAEILALGPSVSSTTLGGAA